MSKKALLAGKHVVIEKPFTITSAEAAELIEIASRNQKILTVYHNRRWDGDFLTVKKIIENKMLGELVEYESHFDRFRNFIKPGSWKEENLPGNGLLYDIGSHLIDQAVLLFDTPISIFADLRVQRLGGKIIDSFELILDYKNLKVTLKSNFLSKTPLPRFILHGTEGSFIKEGLDTQEDELKKRGYKNSSEWGKEPVELWGRMDTKVNGLNFKGKIETIPGSYQSFYDDLYESIMNGKELSVKPEDAMNTIRIIELAMESKKRKCTIDLSDYPE